MRRGGLLVEDHVGYPAHQTPGSRFRGAVLALIRLTLFVLARRAPGQGVVRTSKAPAEVVGYQPRNWPWLAQKVASEAARTAATRRRRGGVPGGRRTSAGRGRRAAAPARSRCRAIRRATGPPARCRSRPLRPSRSGGRATAAVMRWACRLAERHSARLICGQVQHQVPDAEREQRDDAQHPGGHHDPGAAPQAGDARVPAAPGQRALHDGGDAGEQVRHADRSLRMK